MTKVIQRFGKKTKVFWMNEEESIIRQTLRATRGKAIAVSYSADGFHLKPNQDNDTGLELCGENIRRRCDGVPVWRTIQRGAGYTATGYYCDEHLDPELRPDGEQETLFSSK
jgi:hypothetical protein